MTSLAVRAAWLTLCGAVLFAAPAPAHACTCDRTAPACEAFWRAPAVFSAAVLDIRQKRDPAGGAEYLAERIVTLQVEQSWRGDAAGVVEVRTGTGAGDCGYTFIRGIRYLVYASYRAGGFGVYICSRTRPLTEASDDLAYLKTALEPSAAGRVFGSVKYQGTRATDTDRPVARVPVTLRGVGREWKTTTDEAGAYEFRVPAGRYQVHVDVAPAERAYGTASIELADVRGCAAADFIVVPRRGNGGDGAPLRSR
jgi:hypothetical protein